jgi:uncharacterized circularly permuted ATP-grasp superfamily protein/uncharacterized alpha-E superfamily protein
MSEIPSPSKDAPGQTEFMNWLQLHAPKAPEGHWDELRDQLENTGGNRNDFLAPTWAAFIEQLGPQGLTSLSPRMHELQRQVRDNGVTYNVYADNAQPQRPWSLDLFPLIISPRHWQQIERGVLQRMRLLEHIMQDAYGPQQLVASGQLPAALVQGHPGYLPAMQGMVPTDGRYLSMAAFDLARGPDGLWWLLSQRTQAPSGLGYLLENRLIISRLFPKAFDNLSIQRLASTYQALVKGLKARSPVPPNEVAHIALLTPGPFNETYFEHAYLARYLGLSLVQADDLTVRDEGLFLKTVQGLQRVHGLLKRVDDAWLDPLELRSDSSLGVPGLLQAVRKGQVLVANTPGSGFLESNALLGFMPALAQSLLKEELVLPAIPSWWCGESAALAQALEHVPEGLIKPTYPQDGQRPSFEPQPGRLLNPRERQAWTERILQSPQAHTIQSWLPLSHQPIWNPQAQSHGAVETRPVVLRVFVVVDENKQWQVLPGGLARLGSHEGIASMQRGGSSADVWVQAPTPEAVHPLSLLADASAPRPSQRLVTSRAAENLFWLGRYSERTENTLALSRLTLEMLVSEQQSHGQLLSWLDGLSRRHGLVRQACPSAMQSQRVFERSVVAGLWDTTHSTGVGYNLKHMLNAATTVRERLSPEHWQMLQDTEQRFFQAAPSVPNRIAETALAQRALADLSQRMAALTGAQTDRMSRDDGWRFLSLGRHIERLDFLSHALGLGLAQDLVHNQAGFDAVLQLFDSTISFHAQYQQTRTLWALMDLLVLNPDNPRSLAWVVHTLRSRLKRLQHLADGATLELAQRIPAMDAPALQALLAGQPQALVDWLHQWPVCARQMAEGLSAQFFTHSQQHRHSVGA